MYVLRYITVAYTHVYSKDLMFVPWPKSNKKIQGLQGIDMIEFANKPKLTYTDQNMRRKIPLTKILNWTAGCELWSGRPYCRPWSVPWAAGLWVMGLLLAKPIKALVRYTFSNRTPPTLLQHSDVDPATKCEPLAKWCLSWRYSWTLPL